MRAVRCDMVCQIAQRAENVLIVCAVGAQLQAIAFGYNQGDFEYVDRIEAKTFAVQRIVKTDIVHRDFKVQSFDHQFGDFAVKGSCFSRWDSVGHNGIEWENCPVIIQDVANFVQPTLTASQLIDSGTVLG